MQGIVRRYFPGGNTYKGFHSFFEEALADLNRVFIIKGGPGTGKSTFIKSIGSQMQSMGYDVDYLCCSGDASSIDGVIIKKLGVGIVDGTAPHVIDPKFPGAVDEIINFGDVWNEKVLIDNKDHIIEINKQIKHHYKTAYYHLNNAKDVRDKIENVFIRNMNLKEIDRIAQNLFDNIIREPKINDNQKITDRFSGAITHKGIMSYMGEIVGHIKTRYILKSPSIELSSTILKRLEGLIKENGYDISRYHDYLNPELINMLIIPQCDTLIVSRDYFHPAMAIGDGEIIDISSLCTISESMVEELNILEGKKKTIFEHIEKGVAEMAKSKALHDDLEVFYIKAMDFERLKVIKDRVVNKINSYID